MEHCPVENFNQLAAAIGRIERFLGLDGNEDPTTIVGRLKSVSTYTASQPITKHRAVRLTAVGALHASNVDAQSSESIVGIALNDAALGEEVTVQSFGLLKGLTATFDTSMSVVLGLDGALTQGPPTGSVLVSIGRPVSNTEMFVDVSTPIFL